MVQNQTVDSGKAFGQKKSPGRYVYNLPKGMIWGSGYKADALFQHRNHAFQLKGIVGAVTVYGANDFGLCLVDPGEHGCRHTTVGPMLDCCII